MPLWKKNAKTGHFTFRAEPGKYILVAGDSRHAATTKEVTLKKGENKIALELTRLSPFSFDKPDKSTLPKSLDIPSPLAAMNIADNAIREAMASGGTLDELQAISEAANDKYNSIKQTLEPHLCGKYWAQANGWLIAGKSGENRYPQFDSWQKQYKKNCEQMLLTLNKRVAEYLNNSIIAGKELSALYGQLRNLPKEFNAPTEWSSIRSLYLGVEEVEPHDLSQIKASVEAELTEVSIPPSAMSIYELRSIANKSNPFTSRRKSSSANVKTTRERAEKARAGFAKLQSLKVDLDKLLSQKGIMLLKPSMLRGYLPQNLNNLVSKWTSYRGKKETITVEARVDNGLLMETAKEYGYLNLEGKAISTYYDSELEPRQELFEIYEKAFNSWSQWHSRALAHLHKIEEEEERIRNELLDLSKELESSFKELDKNQMELQSLRNKSNSANYDVDRLRTSPNSLEYQKRASAAINDASLQDKALGQSEKATTVVNKIEAANYKLLRLTQNPSFGTLRDRPSLPSSFYGNEKTSYFHRVRTVTDMRSKTLSNMKKLRLASIELSSSLQATKSNELRIQEMEKQIQAALADLEKRAALATSLDGIAKALPKRFMDGEYKTFESLVTSVESGKITVSNSLRRLAGSLKSKLQQIEYLTTRALEGYTRKWYEAFANDYKQKAISKIMERLDNSWRCAGKSDHRSQEKQLKLYFAENDFGHVKFSLKKFRQSDNHKLSTEYDVVITGSKLTSKGQLYKVDTIKDELRLTEQGVKITSTSKPCWAIMDSPLSFSQLHLGYGLLGLQHAYRYVTQSQLSNGKAVLAGIANGVNLTVKSIQVSVNGGATYQEVPLQQYGNRAIFHHSLKMSSEADIHLVLKGSNDKETYTRWPQSKPFTIRCSKESPDEIVTFLTRHVFKAWNDGHVERVLAVFSQNYFGQFKRLSTTLRKEVTTRNNITLTAMAIGNSGAWKRVVIEWKNKDSGPHKSCLFFNNAFRIVDIRGKLPFGNSDSNLIETANYPIDKRVLRGRIELDYSRDMCERDQLLMGPLFSHGIAIPSSSVNSAVTDIVLRHPMLIFSTKGTIVDGNNVPLNKMVGLPKDGWTHALFRKGIGTTFFVSCRNNRWAAGKIDELIQKADVEKVVLSYHYNDEYKLIESSSH